MEMEIKSLLKEHNLKVTKIRLDVLELMIKSGVAMSHAQISEKLGQDHVDKVTLYRTLNTFTEVGIAHKVATEDRNWLYAIYEHDGHSHNNHGHEHAHFICDECDKIYCFPIDEHLTEIQQQIQKGFQIKSKEIRLHGTCPICQ
jgi:Fur family ferric uptake transcriptional regulator